jgi:hypothetical protein
MNKDELKQTFTKVDVPNEDITVDPEHVKLGRSWSFWETYEPKVKSSQTDWSVLIKKVFTFQDIISFWQFWNCYPGSNFSEVFFDGGFLK